MLLSIIIVNYNTGPLTKACIESVLTKRLPWPIEIIVVDNASRDESVSFLRSDFPEVNVIANKDNVGLAAGINAGMAAAKGNYYLILNPDIIVLPQAIETMVTHFRKNPAVGMVGAKLISPNGHLQYSCYRFYKPLTIIYRRTWLGKTQRGNDEVSRFLMKDYNHQSARDVDWLMGACLMVRAKAVQQVGGMDQRFFLYFEDVDWCRRFWQSGWRVSYVPQAQFSHYHQRSSEQGGVLGILVNKSVRHHITSALKYFWKYRGQAVPHVRINSNIRKSGSVRL